ncbi:serine/threonine protein kinase [Candidatus Magnetoovum chiemensis]|nr:serine/threonine protein kinase [Candidatus Magnetoovum chiemensis]
MKFILRITVLLLIFATVTSAAFYVTYILFTSSKTIEVPDLQGKNLVEVNEILSRLRLYLKVAGEDYDAAQPRGYIIRQDTPPGNKIKENRTISVILSKGPYVQYMPDFRGLTIDEAHERASSNTLKIRSIISVHSEDIESGIVISQRPAPEEKGSKDVSLIVSSGTYGDASYCPDLTGKTLSDAQSIAESKGLKIHLSGTGNKVISQSPSSGGIIKKGDTINLTLGLDKKETVLKSKEEILQESRPYEAPTPNIEDRPNVEAKPNVEDKPYINSNERTEKTIETPQSNTDKTTSDDDFNRMLEEKLKQLKSNNRSD